MHGMQWHGQGFPDSAAIHGCENSFVFRSLKRPAALALALPLATLLTGCRSTPQAKPLEQLTPQEQAGHAVFREHCSLCHYDRVSKPLNGPALLGLYQKPYLPSGAPANDERVSNTILHGRNNMPAQGGRLTDQDLTELLAYLHTL